MQTKKEDIEQRIIEVATDEFMKKGYENTSMRVIAYKANTSLGNIYHYFKNKELLLQTIIMPTLENIEYMMDQHIFNSKDNMLTKDEAMAYADHLDELFEQSELRCFLDKKVVIILNLESSSLLERKEKLLKNLQEHIQQHFHMQENEHYSKLIIDILADCLRHVLIEYEDIEQAKIEFINVFKLFSTGIIGQMKCQ